MLTLHASASLSWAIMGRARPADMPGKRRETRGLPALSSHAAGQAQCDSAHSLPGRRKAWRGEVGERRGASDGLPMLKVGVDGVLNASVVAVEVVELVANLIQVAQ